MTPETNREDAGKVGGLGKALRAVLGLLAAVAPLFKFLNPPVGVNANFAVFFALAALGIASLLEVWLRRRKWGVILLLAGLACGALSYVQYEHGKDAHSAKRKGSYRVVVGNRLTAAGLKELAAINSKTGAAPPSNDAAENAITVGRHCPDPARIPEYFEDFADVANTLSLLYACAVGALSFVVYGVCMIVTPSRKRI